MKIFLVQISTLKSARQLCSTITQKGANLHELLGKELDARVSNFHKQNLFSEVFYIRKHVKML